MFFDVGDILNFIVNGWVDWMRKIPVRMCGWGLPD